MDKMMNIQKLLMLGFALPCVLVLLMGGVVVYVFNGNIDGATMLSESDAPLLLNLKSSSSDMLLHRRYEKDFLISIGKREKQEEYLLSFEKQKEISRQHVDRVVDFVISDGELPQEIVDAAKRLNGNLEKYFDVFSEVAVVIQKDSLITTGQGDKLMAKGKPYTYAFEDDLKNILQEDYSGMRTRAI